MVNAKSVADYFLAFQEDESGESITHLKLQKLLYYAQGFYLALYGKPLFSEKIYAWDHGPVVKDLYRVYSPHGRNPIPKNDDADLTVFEPEQAELLAEVWNGYGQYSAWRLREMTHEEPPYRETPLSCEITHEKMRDFFKTRLVA